MAKTKKMAKSLKICLKICTTMDSRMVLIKMQTKRKDGKPKWRHEQKVGVFWNLLAHCNVYQDVSPFLKTNLGTQLLKYSELLQVLVLLQNVYMEDTCQSLPN